MQRILPAAGGLSLVCEAPHWRVEWQQPDWLGPVELRSSGASISPELGRLTDGGDDLGGYLRAEVGGLAAPLRASVRAYRDVPILVFRLETDADLRDFGTGTFIDTTLTWPALFPARRAPGGAAEGTRTYGHQYSEFGLPVSGTDAAIEFLFAPHRPSVVEPLLFIAPDGRTLLLAPLDQFHEQIISVPIDTEHVGDGVRCGWHGDLAEIPAGFATEFAIWAAPTPRAGLDAWAALLRRRHATRRRGRYADDGVGKLSYWTDNGAVYYYRTAPECDYTTTLERAVEALRAQKVPVRSVQIDSWFYPHKNLRAVGPHGGIIVPPSGMMKWEPREDLFADGFADLRRRVGDLPLTFHSRHFSSESRYAAEYECWVDGDYAHPSDERALARLMEQAASWGAITYEQDWMVESFLGVRGLRAAPGRARSWQEALDRTAGARGLTLQWCMSTPADFMQTVTLENLTSIRTSGDYRYLFDNGLNWVWFLHTNALARAFGLTPYKDVFVSHATGEQQEGEQYAETEALLATLSSGPVGIGDEIGCTDRDVVMRTCREDGVLIKPDVPIAALDRCFARNPYFERVPLIGETHSQHPAGRWLYIATFNASRSKKPITYRVDLADLGNLRPSSDVIAFDWRKRSWQRVAVDAGWEGTLEWQDWDYRVLCPVLPGEITVFGDVGKFATTGDRRVASISAVDGGVAFDVLGVPGTSVEVWGWSARRPADVAAWEDGIWRMRVEIGEPVVTKRVLSS